eukprot:s36_g7.t1
MVIATLAILMPPLLAMVLFPTPEAMDDGFLPSLPKDLWSKKCVEPWLQPDFWCLVRAEDAEAEILLVSDGNDQQGIFERELKAMHQKVQVIVNEENKGLIVTKMETAARATAPVLMFLEPHVVVTPQWLEPLLARLEEEPKALVMPSLDVLNKEQSGRAGERDMSTYLRMQFLYWRFEWNLNLIADNPLRKDIDTAAPYPSPATSGGIYAIRKEWWDHLEFFDPELIRWGGDHVEASHKVWRCGGRIEIHPCSRVGHWFREEKDRPYTVQVPDVVRNYKRLAEVWLDGHRKSFYKVKPEAQSMHIGNLKEMKAARERLKCHDMDAWLMPWLWPIDLDWYLKNVDVELAWEEDHICIPGASKAQFGCDSATPAPQRSTLDKAGRAELAPGGSFLTPLNGSMPWVSRIEMERPGVNTKARSVSEKRLPRPLAPLVEHTGSSTRQQPVLAQSLVIPEGGPSARSAEPEDAEFCRMLEAALNNKEGYGLVEDSLREDPVPFEDVPRPASAPGTAGPTATLGVNTARPEEKVLVPGLESPPSTPIKSTSGTLTPLPLPSSRGESPGRTLTHPFGPAEGATPRSAAECETSEAAKPRVKSPRRVVLRKKDFAQIMAERRKLEESQTVVRVNRD